MSKLAIDKLMRLDNPPLVAVVADQAGVESLPHAFAFQPACVISDMVETDTLIRLLTEAARGATRIVAVPSDWSVEAAPPLAASAPSAPTAVAADKDELSRRELQVLRGLAYGRTNRQIAENLGISVKTIDSYRTRLTDKLGTRRRSGLVREAIARGLFDEPD